MLLAALPMSSLPHLSTKVLATEVEELLQALVVTGASMDPLGSALTSIHRDADRHRMIQYLNWIKVAGEAAAASPLSPSLAPGTQLQSSSGARSPHSD